MAYKWKKEYEEKGFAVFDKQTAYLLKLVEQKYEKDYTLFIADLMRDYDTMKGHPQARKVLEELYQQLASISRLAGVLRGKEGGYATPEQINELFEDMRGADENFSYILKQAEQSELFKKRLAEAQKTSGISLSTIARTNKIVKSRMENLSKSKTLTGKIVGGIGAGAAGIGGLAVGMLGMIAPLAPIAELALLSGRGIGKMVRRAKEAQVAKEEHHLAEDLTQRDEFGFEDVEKNFERLRSIPPYLRDSYSGYYKAGYRYDDRARATGAGRREAVGGMGPEGRTAGDVAVSSGALSDGLTMFFMKPAYKAGWTRDVLNALNKMSGKATGEAGAGSGVGGTAAEVGVGTALGRGAAVIAPWILPVAIPAGIVTLLGGLFKKITDDRTLWGVLADAFKTISGMATPEEEKRSQKNLGRMGVTFARGIEKSSEIMSKSIYSAFGLGSKPLATAKALAKENAGYARLATATPMPQIDKGYASFEARLAYSGVGKFNEFRQDMKDFNTSLIAQYKSESEKTRGALNKFTMAMGEQKSAGKASTGRSVQREMFNIGDPLVEMLNASSLESE